MPMTKPFEELRARTWILAGYRMEPLRDQVILLVDPPPRQIGSILLPAKYQGLYGGLHGHKATVRAFVLDAGMKTGLKPGERVMFTRTNFVRWQELQIEPEPASKSALGWMQAHHIMGVLEEEDEEARARHSPALEGAWVKGA